MMEYTTMAIWRSRIYTCKHCKKSVEIFPKDEYICDKCNEPLLSNLAHNGFYIGTNPMARQTKMEFSEQSHEATMKDFGR